MKFNNETLAIFLDTDQADLIPNEIPAFGTLTLVKN
jgi:hypothetical protein